MKGDRIAAVEAELNEATRRAWTLVRSTEPRLFTVRPDASSWSAAECLAHLTVSSNMFVDPLRSALAKASGSKQVRAPKMDLVGAVLRWFMEPPIRSRFKTTAPFVPRAVRPRNEAFREFAAAQEALIELLRSTDAARLTNARIRSPFDRRVRYNAYSAFRIIAAHERRHLWQAERAVESLRLRG